MQIRSIRYILTLTLFFSLSIVKCQLSIAQSQYVAIVETLQNGDTEQATLMLEKMVKKDKKESQWYKLLDDTYKSKAHRDA